MCGTGEAGKRLSPISNVDRGEQRDLDVHDLSCILLNVLTVTALVCVFVAEIGPPDHHYSGI